MFSTIADLTCVLCNLYTPAPHHLHLPRTFVPASHLMRLFRTFAPAPHRHALNIWYLTEPSHRHAVSILIFSSCRFPLLLAQVHQATLTWSGRKRLGRQCSRPSDKSKDDRYRRTRLSRSRSSSRRNGGSCHRYRHPDM